MSTEPSDLTIAGALRLLRVVDEAPSLAAITALNDLRRSRAADQAEHIAAEELATWVFDMADEQLCPERHELLMEAGRRLANIHPSRRTVR